MLWLDSMGLSKDWRLFEWESNTCKVIPQHIYRYIVRQLQTARVFVVMYKRTEHLHKKSNVAVVKSLNSFWNSKHSNSDKLQETQRESMYINKLHPTISQQGGVHDNIEQSKNNEWQRLTINMYRRHVNDRTWKRNVSRIFNVQVLWGDER